MDPIPDLLYKYVSPERIDVLREKRIRFTQPCFLNDPFEFRPGMPEAPAHFEEKIAKKRETVCEGESQNAGILSLTEKRDSIPMWAHYADAHRGFAIGFDTGSSFFKPAIANGKVRRVRYECGRPSLTRGLPPDRPWEGPDSIFWTKSPEWSYELEWRWIECSAPLDYAEVLTTAGGQILYLRPLPPGTVCEVVLGYRVDPKTAEEILALKSTAEYEHLHLSKVVLSKTHYSLEVTPL